MPGWTDLEERMKKMEPVRKAFGPVKNRAVPVFEDSVNYPIDEVVELFKLSRKIEATEFGPETTKMVEEFAAKLDSIKPVADPKPRIYLWDEGNMPTITEYTDNSDYKYNHNPDFKPYMFEMLLPEDVTPKGAVVLCAGGDHGDSALCEAYQVALDLNKLGYQCFNLLNRTNHNPWTSKEAGADAARAMRMVRKNADRYRIDPNNVTFAGFSNGGLTGEGLIEHFSGDQKVADVFPDYKTDELDEINATPDAFLCIYGPRFAGAEFDYNGVVYPPTFFAVGREDFAMNNLHPVYCDLVERKIPVEIHTFAGVPHGQAGAPLIDGEVKYPNFELWLPLADAFMQDIYQSK